MSKATAWIDNHYTWFAGFSPLTTSALRQVVWTAPKRHPRKGTQQDYLTAHRAGAARAFVSALWRTPGHSR
jgi:hypothetical protein